MLNLTHEGLFTELRRLENVEMLSVTSCVERRRLSCFKFQIIHYLSRKKIKI